MNSSVYNEYNSEFFFLNLTYLFFTSAHFKNQYCNTDEYHTNMFEDANTRPAKW